MCSAGPYLKNGLHSLVLLCRKSDCSGAAQDIFVATPTVIQGKFLAQDYIKLNTGLVNNFNNFNGICNIFHICMEKNATVFVGLSVKAIILIIIFYRQLKPDTRNH